MFCLYEIDLIGFCSPYDKNLKHLTYLLVYPVLMNEKLIHSFEGTCPLTTYGVYGIKKRYFDLTRKPSKFIYI